MSAILAIDPGPTMSAYVVLAAAASRSRPRSCRARMEAAA